MTSKNHPKIKTIEAEDCSPLLEQSQKLITPDLMKMLMDFEEFSMFGKKKENQKEPLLYFDYNQKGWRAGRYIGEATFRIGQDPTVLRITPRFTNHFLYLMLEEIFNIKITNSGNSTVTKNVTSLTIRILVSYIWLLKLGNANRHGLPRVNYTEFHSGSLIRGRLDLKKSIPSIFTKGEATFTTRTKKFDETIFNILRQAHRILVKEYLLGKCKSSNTANQAIQQIEAIGRLDRVTPNEYQSIQYHTIYESFKPVVDLSWRILRSKISYDSGDSNESMNGFFLDMAEIWETYTRSCLKKKFAQYGWELINETNYRIYNDQYFQRSLIPDIVFKRGDEVIVLDAKYKKNSYQKDDVDRLDLFQIHTYVSYLQSKYTVRLAGLVYPMETEGDKSFLTNLFSIQNNNTLFLADGPLVEDDTVNWEPYFEKIKGMIEN